MKRIMLPLCMILIAVLISNQNAALANNALEAKPEWSSLNSIPNGYEVLVELKNGKKEKGHLTAVTDVSITLSRKEKSKALGRENVLKVFRLVKKNAAKFALFGAGIGGGAGAGTIAGIGGDDGGALNPGFVVAGSLIGAGIGSLIGLAISTRKSKVLVYQAD